MLTGHNLEIEAGYLIVKTFPKLYKDYVQRYALSTSVYALPRIDLGPDDYEIQYRGIDRDALTPYTDSDNLAEIRMSEMEKDSRCGDGFLFTQADVNDVMSYLIDSNTYEIIWTKIAKSNDKPPDGFISIGFEPSWFIGDHFSASCDSMLIPRWHGTDEGTLFKDYFDKLNRYGLFETYDIAKSFLDFYLSFDCAETGEYEITEVFIKMNE